MTENNKIAKARIPLYLRALRLMLEKNKYRTSSAELANELGFSAPMVRQDLARVGKVGLRGYGYDVANLYTSLLDYAGVRDSYSAVIIGTEETVNILKKLNVFSRHGITLKKCFVFDNILPPDFKQFCQTEKTDIIAVATSDDKAKEVFDIISESDFKGVCNFTSFTPELTIPQKNVRLDDIFTELCLDITNHIQDK